MKVKIEKVDLWTDRMDLVPDGDGDERDGFSDGFSDGFGALCSLQNLCRDGTYGCRLMTL